MKIKILYETKRKYTLNMNLSDPELELIDPTPNVHTLFLHFDQIFFWTRLASRTAVRWSKRMYSCAGTCSYDKGGLCDIALSEPLLKLRPRKDLVETLLHEMIHAYLFLTGGDRDRDGHGPKFKEHMYRINKAAGLSISIYHDFNDEVDLYLTHWWRCNGPCHTMKPHFGIVRRSANRAPGPSDYWWKGHQRKCGGSFVKIKEPENYGKNNKKGVSTRSNGDITKYINTTNNEDKVKKPVLKDTNVIPVKSNLIIKSNKSSTLVVTKRNNVVYNPKVVKSPIIFGGKGQTTSRICSNNSLDVIETVRNVWGNKQLPSKTDKGNTKDTLNKNSTISENTNKHKADGPHILSPRSKIKKIDDYFKRNATSLLKDLYGKDFEIKETSSNKRLSVVLVNTILVDCPVCKYKVSSEEINRHLDECLNNEVIESIKGDDLKVVTVKSETNKCNNDSNLLHNNERISVNVKNENKSDISKIKIEPSTSKSLDKLITTNDKKCPCCDKIVNKSINEHLDECLAFFDNDTTMPKEGASTSFTSDTIVIDDDSDIFDETLILNATGTKSPCPCCLQMIEQVDMNDHLDACLS